MATMIPSFGNGSQRMTFGERRFTQRLKDKLNDINLPLCPLAKPLEFMSTIIPASDPAYQDFLREIKAQVVQSRLGAARSVNRALIGLYWSLGKLIVERQEALGWGQAVVERLSADLKAEFPDMTGFSPRNLCFFKQFYETYADAPEFLKQAVSEIPWGHNILIMQRVKAEAARRYYLEASARLGWTRNVLLNQIQAGAYEVGLSAIIRQHSGFGVPGIPGF